MGEEKIGGVGMSHFENLSQDTFTGAINSLFAPSMDWECGSEKIKSAEMSRIVEERVSKEREGMLKLFDMIYKSGTANLGIVNYNNGKITTPYGVDVSFDRRLVAQVLKKAKFIKEGSFHETKGIPVIKVTGNIEFDKIRSAYKNRGK